MRIKVTKTSRLITRTWHVEVDVVKLGIRAPFWPYRLLERYEKDSELLPLLFSEVEQLLSGFSVLAEEAIWQEIATTDPAELRPAVVSMLFHRLEELLDGRAWKYNTKRNISIVFRKQIQRWWSKEYGNAVLAKENLRFKSMRFAKSGPPRQLISDMVVEKGEPPISTTPHTTAAELKKLTTERLARDIAAIETACHAELDEYERQAEYLQSEAKADISDSSIDAWQAALSSTTHHYCSIEISKIPDGELFRLYLAHTHAGHEGSAYPPFPGGFHQLRRVRAYALKNAPVRKMRGYDILYYAQCGDGMVLTACLHLLQIHTSWNGSSVLSLGTNMISRSGNVEIIQGTKTKTDDHTPDVVVSGADRGAYRALQILRKRLENLRLLKLVPTTATELFLSPRYGKPTGKRVQVYQNFKKPQNQLCKLHNLPRFSMDQLRVQMLNFAAAAKGGIEVARRLGGHASAGATAHYLDQAIQFRMNAATNLEFQRRLERSIEYVAEKDFGLGGVAQEPSGFLLYPVGDGSSCSDPEQPPTPAWVTHGICRAEHCHENQGCPNRRIVVDGDRINEFAITAVYYESQWGALLAKNQARFYETHLPAMLFSLGMVGIIQRGPFGAHMRQALAIARGRYYAE